MAKAGKRKFFSEFFKKNSQVGSITPSSRFLSNKMLRNIDFSKPAVIIELGPGTGIFTKTLVKKLHPESKLYVFELNKEFTDSLNKQYIDPRVQIICDSAEKMMDYLSKDGIEAVDYIVSSLPLSLIPEDIRRNIITQCFENLKSGGIMTQFQYSQHCKKNFKQIFNNVRVDFTVFNIPPAFVYVCTK